MRHAIKHVVDAILIMNALVVIRKDTLHDNIIDDLIDKLNTIETQQS